MDVGPEGGAGMNRVTVPLTLRCPLCGTEVGSGERHACTREDGSAARIYIESFEMEVEDTRAKKPKKRKERISTGPPVWIK